MSEPTDISIGGYPVARILTREDIIRELLTVIETPRYRRRLERELMRISPLQSTDTFRRG